MFPALPALHAFDPVLGLDSHLALLPSSPVPVPVPVLFVGALFDWKDYLPPNFVRVLIHYLPRATTGSAGYGKHFPLFPFVRRKLGEAEVLLGSSTVFAEGGGLGMGPLPVLTCHDLGSARARSAAARKWMGPSLMAPSSFVLPLPLPYPVFVGGTPTPSPQALVSRLKSGPLRVLRKSLQKTKAGRGVVREMRNLEQAWSRAEKASTEDWTPPWTPYS